MTNTATTPATALVKINRAATVHMAWTYQDGGIGSTLCASEGRNGARPYYRRMASTDTVTCKKCAAAMVARG